MFIHEFCLNINWFIMQRKQLILLVCISHLHFLSQAVCSKSIYDDRYIDMSELYSSKRSLLSNIAYGKKRSLTYSNIIKWKSARRSQSWQQTKQEINLLFIRNHICMILNVPNSMINKWEDWTARGIFSL